MDLSPSERAVLAYAAVICLPWSYLIADETITIGEPNMRMKCEAMLDEHRQTSGLVFLSRSPARLKQYCEVFLVLLDGRLRLCTDLEAAEHALSLSQRQKKDDLIHV